MGELLPQSYWASYALSLGNRVKTIRVMRGLTQSRLAELAGVSRSLISNLERNDYNGARAADPTLSTIYRLAAALYVPPAALLPGADGLVGKPLGAHELARDVEAAVGMALQWHDGPLDTVRLKDAPQAAR